MGNSFNLHIITPEKTLYSSQAEMVGIPGAEGDFGVLAGHAPVIATLRPGVISIEGHDNRRIAVAGGMAEVTPEGCTILADQAEDCTDVTPAEAQSRLAAAKAALAEAYTDAMRQEAQARLALAEAMAA